MREIGNPAETAPSPTVIKEGVRAQMGEGTEMNPTIVFDGVYSLREDKGVEVTNWHVLLQTKALSAIMRDEAINQLDSGGDNPEVVRKVLTVGRDLLHIDAAYPELDPIFTGLDTHLKTLDAQKPPGEPGLVRRVLGGVRDRAFGTIQALDYWIPRPLGPDVIEGGRLNPIFTQPLTEEDHKRAWIGLTDDGKNKKLVDLYTSLKDRKPSDFEIQERSWLAKHKLPAQTPAPATPATPAPQAETSTRAQTEIARAADTSPPEMDPLKEIIKEYGSAEAAVVGNLSLFQTVPALKTPSAEALARLMEEDEIGDLVARHGEGTLREVYIHINQNSTNADIKKMAQQRLSELDNGGVDNPHDTAAMPAQPSAPAQTQAETPVIQTVEPEVQDEDKFLREAAANKEDIDVAAQLIQDWVAYIMKANPGMSEEDARAEVMKQFSTQPGGKKPEE